MRQRQWKPRSRLRRTLRRSSIAWWTAAVVLALITASTVSANLSRAAREADAWGSQYAVWVVRRAVPAGDVIAAGDVALTRRPKRVVPRGAIGRDATPVGDAARVALVPGEVVVGGRLSARGARGIAAQVGAGHRAVAVPVDESSPALRVGDRIDVIATFDVGDAAAAPGEQAPSVAVASDAEVLAVTAKAVTLAVTSREAPRVAFALARAAVTLALRGGISEPARSR